MFAKRWRCGRCKQAVDFTFGHVAEYEARDILPPQQRPGFRMRAISMGDDDDGPEVTGYGTALCPLCHRPSFFLFKVQQRHLRNIAASLNTPEGLFGGGDLIEVFEALPTPPEPVIDRHWPAEIHDHFRDAQNMLDQGMSPAFIITACRSVLETSVKRLGAQGGNLYGRIDDLRAKGVITEGLKDWAHAVRAAGNDAVHELNGTAAEAKELVDFTRQFLDVAFTLPATIAARKQAAFTPPAAPASSTRPGQPPARAR